MSAPFVAAYVEAALWAENDESEAWALAELSPEARERLEADAAAFYAAHEADVEAYPEGVTQAGHDLWFTRRGHGVGYWEQSDPVSERLDAAAKALGDCELYLGDDGKIYAV